MNGAWRMTFSPANMSRRVEGAKSADGTRSSACTPARMVPMCLPEASGSAILWLSCGSPSWYLTFLLPSVKLLRSVRVVPRRLASLMTLRRGPR
jgi:hypothetical protein